MSGEVNQPHAPESFYSDVAELRSGRLRALFDLWLECRADAALPGLAAIDPFALKRFLTDLVVVDVCDPEQPRFRLVGSGYRDFFNRDYAGALVRYTDFPEREQIADSYRRVALSGQPLLGWYRWQSDDGGIYYSEFVVLPYGKGSRVERLVVMEDLDAARHGAASAPDGTNG